MTDQALFNQFLSVGRITDRQSAFFLIYKKTKIDNPIIAIWAKNKLIKELYPFFRSLADALFERNTLEKKQLRQLNSLQKKCILNTPAIFETKEDAVQSMLMSLIEILDNYKITRLNLNGVIFFSLESFFKSAKYFIVGSNKEELQDVSRLWELAP